MEVKGDTGKLLKESAGQGSDKVSEGSYWVVAWRTSSKVPDW